MKSARQQAEDCDLDLDRDGACHAPGLAAPVLGDFIRELAEVPEGRAGVRIARAPGLRALLDETSAIGAWVSGLARCRLQPVRAVLFDKTASGNWTLGWHQDRTIAVRERHEEPGFGPWSVKQGLIHVEPPFAVLEAMMTVRIHLDLVDAGNAPLRIVPGSHRHGRIPVGAVAAHVEGGPAYACLAEAGDVWIYRTPILHASDPARGTSPSRRVLQVDYSGEALPGALEWLGIG